MKSLARKLLPEAVKRTLKSSLDNLNQYIFPFFSRSIWLASFYYFFISSRFGREQHAVLAGRLKYKQGGGIGEGSSALLRRNIHRIEKGLIMRPRKQVFAEAYIEETVDCYRRCLVLGGIDSQEVQWAHDVLYAYFSVVEPSSIVTSSRAVFESCELSDSSGCKPYAHSQLPQTDITISEFKALCTRRRSVRWYQATPVPEQLIDQALEVASLAPSACNRQPFSFHILNDLENANKVASLAGGSVGFAENIPCIAVVVGDLSAYPMERDRHVIYVDGSLAAMQFMLALETLGLSSCTLNWPDVDLPEQKMAKILKLQPYERPIMLIAIGHADSEGLIPFSQKKSAKQLRRDIQL